MVAKKTKKSNIDVSNHILVPKHSKLSEKEKEKLMAKYNVTIKKMPKIMATDSALYGLDVKPGDVIKIVRPSQTAGTSVFYRGVVND